jgi:hypothetical protein
MDERVVFVISDNNLFPGGCDMQSGFATGTTDNVNFTITREVGRYGYIASKPFPD